ncbi:MAG: hypothetical protein ISN28_04245 [Ectothiorhodospiraceae bacterium AqS1]|nr:hypothetical protein [Ectothiorhodospiraceae bacterium AqS1]
MKDGEDDGRDLEIKELQSKVGELTMLLELKDEKIVKIGDRPPFGALRGQGDESCRLGPSEKKPYGVERVCKGWQMSGATVYRLMKEASRTSDGPPSRPRWRRGSDGLMPDAQIDAIEQVEWMSFGDSPFHGEGYRKGARA